MALRKIAEFTNGNRQARVYRDAEWNEYRARFYTLVRAAGALIGPAVWVLDKEADAHDSDKDSCIATAKACIADKAMAVRAQAADTFKHDYLISLQENAAHHAHMARVHVINANANPSLYCAQDDRSAAVREQERAALQFSRIAGVRGFFD